MARPSELPTWATTLANRLKPVSGAFISGFNTSERPPARWVNWLLGMICDWLGYFDDTRAAHEKAIANGFASFVVNSGTYADGDYYDLTDGVLTVSPRTNPDAFAASSGGGDYIRLAASPTPGTEAQGVWLVTVDMDFDLGGAAATANAVTGLELIEHATGSADPTTGSTVVTKFISTIAAGAGGRVFLRGSHLMRVTSSTAPRLSFRVSSGYSQDCTSSSRRRFVSVLQLSKDLQ